MEARYSLGFDFGTQSVRVLLVDVNSGRIARQATSDYPHGVITQSLPTGGAPLPPDYALQHPRDWLDALAVACRSAVSQARVPISSIVGIGVDFTSCTMLPAKNDGTPLCLIDPFQTIPLAWPKLWKHQGAKTQADRINQVARERKEPWLQRYGGSIGPEWFFPKVLETLDAQPVAYEAADVWIEAGDWLVWQLIAGPYPDCTAEKITRSTCQAGYKAMWNSKSGFPSSSYFAAVHPKLADVVTAKLPGTMLAPGQRAGELTEAAASLLGLRAGIPVSAAIIDVHAGVLGAGVAEADTLVMILGTSACHMLNSKTEKLVPGVAGIVEDGILPGFFGYESGQVSVGDALAWLAQITGRSHDELSRHASKLSPGSGGVMALDWLNGCCTPLMDGRLSGAFIGLTLDTRPEQLYRALLESTAFGVRWIADTLRDAGVQVKKFVAGGGLPGKSPLLMQIYADVLGEEISLAQSDEPVALGAAILGAIVAGETATGHPNLPSAIHAMARQRADLIYRPQGQSRELYDNLYHLYRTLARPDGDLANAMRVLRGIG